MDLDPNLRSFDDEKQNNFQISVLNEDPLQLTASKKITKAPLPAGAMKLAKA